MKQLCKHEWKCYLVAILLAAIFMTGYRIHIINNWNWMTIDELGEAIQYYSSERQMDEEIGDIFLIPDQIVSMVNKISYSLTSYENIKIIVLMLLVMKFFRYWTERDAYGREFLVTIPVKERTKKGFYLLADSILVVVSLVIYTAGILIYLTNIFHRIGIEIPWLTKAVLGEMITSICYMLMLLGMIGFLELLFVDGMMKIIGSAGMLAMSAYILTAGFDVFGKTGWMQHIYGFFTFNSAGNQYFGNVADLHDPIWTHTILNPEMRIRGQSITEFILGTGFIDPEEVSWQLGFSDLGEFSRLFDFSRISTYAGLAAGYLAAGCILMAITVWLSGKLDVSKRNGFYFSFGRYLFSLLVGSCFFIICIMNAAAWWHKYLIAAAAVCVTGILLYKTRPGGLSGRIV